MTDPAAAQAGTDPAAGQGTTTATTTPPAATPPPPAVATGAQPTADAFAKLQADLDAANQRATQMQAEARKHEDRWKQRDTQLDEQQKTLRLLADKLGVQLDDKPDPTKLAEQVTQYQTSARQSATELAVFRAAPAGVDANALLDSRSFMAKTSGLDPAAPDFADQVKTLVAEHVAANPALATPPAATQPADGQPAAAPQPAVTPLPAASGPVVTAAPETGRQWTEADLAAASPEETSRAIEQGLLVNLGIGKTRRTRGR